jgi:hypothetical protein
VFSSRHRPVAALCALALLSGGAASQTQEQKNAVGVLAGVVVTHKWCSDTYKVDLDAATDAVIAMRFDLTMPGVKEEAQRQRSYFTKLFADLGTEKACAVMYELLKPGGSMELRGGLMMKR